MTTEMIFFIVALFTSSQYKFVSTHICEPSEQKKKNVMLSTEMSATPKTHFIRPYFKIYNFLISFSMRGVRLFV